MAFQPESLQPGTRIERYEVLRTLGSGGAATVYHVRHVQLGSDHALKVVHVIKPEFTERLLAEGRALAKLAGHPNIVAVTDVLEVKSHPVLVLEYVDGPSLTAFLTRYRPSLEEGLELFRGILAGIDAAHQRGLVHRDLKPDNVLLSPEPHGVVPKVCDFGLVKAITRGGQTHPGDLLGTVEFMAPEQYADPSGVDLRADVWSLGCLLYTLVLDKLAFSARSEVEIWTRLKEGRFTHPLDLDPTLPYRVSDTLIAMLSVDPGARPQSCADISQALFGTRRLDHSPAQLSAAAVKQVELLRRSEVDAEHHHALRETFRRQALGERLAAPPEKLTIGGLIVVIMATALLGIVSGYLLAALF